MVPTPTRDDARRRPATKKKAAAARVDGVEQAPVVGDANGGADGLPLLTAHLLATTASGGDGGDSTAALPKMAGDGGGLATRRGGARRHGRTRERGQTKEEITGNIYISSDRRDQAANGRNRIGKISDSLLEINSKTNSNRIQTSTICFDSWGKKKRRPRGTKPLNQLEEIESDSAGFGAGKAARVRARRGGGRRLGTTLTGGPHLSAAGERGRGRGRRRLGPAWAARGKERGERSWVGFGPKTKKGEILNFLK
jgi:Domain of unknown function (DUF834).